MKLLSESLEDLAAEVEVLEDLTAAAPGADRAVLEERRREVGAAFESAINELQAAVRDAGATALERSGNDTTYLVESRARSRPCRLRRCVDRPSARPRGRRAPPTSPRRTRPSRPRWRGTA